MGTVEQLFRVCSSMYQKDVSQALIVDAVNLARHVCLHTVFSFKSVRGISAEAVTITRAKAECST